MFNLKDIQDAINHCNEIIDRHEVCDSCVKDHKQLKEILEYAYNKMLDDYKYYKIIVNHTIFGCFKTNVEINKSIVSEVFMHFGDNIKENDINHIIEVSKEEASKYNITSYVRE